VMPGLIWRGLTESLADFPDESGYCLSSASHETLMLKRSGEPRQMFHVAPVEKGRECSVILRKEGNRCAVYLNGKAAGVWHESTPLPHPADNRVCIFLRPGERMVLKGLRLTARRIPAKRARDMLTGVKAETVGTGKKQLFNVSLEQEAVEYNNCHYYFLENITDLNRSINQLRAERDRLARTLPGSLKIIGQSPAILSLREQLPVLSESDLTVLVEGETGTGKDVLARLIHDMSPRKKYPFIKVDCSALPESLVLIASLPTCK